MLQTVVVVVLYYIWIATCKAMLEYYLSTDYCIQNQIDRTLDYTEENCLGNVSWCVPFWFSSPDMPENEATFGITGGGIMDVKE